MVDWSAPLVLLFLLAVIPWLRHLHRRRSADVEIVVSSLAPWPASDGGGNAVERERKPDPRWRRRAAIAGALLVAAAGPLLAGRRGVRIEVFVDDGPSLGARDDGGRRLDVAVQRLATALRDVGPADVRLVSLHRAADALTLDVAAPAAWASGIAAWVHLDDGRARMPTAARLRDDRIHWIVTDGADPDVLAWSNATPLARVIWVGTATENVGLTLVAARPHAGNADSLRAIVRVTNAGTVDAQRRLVVSANGVTQATQALDVPAGGAVETAVDVPAAVAALRAAIEPADALPDDDALVLSPAMTARARVRLDPACGPHVARVIRSHPALVEGDGSDPTLIVTCADDAQPASPTVPTLWLRAPLPDAASRAGRTVVTSFDEQQRRLEVHADMEAGEWTEGPEYPALVGELLDTVAGAPLLDRIARVERRSVAITPHEPHPRKDAPPPPNDAPQHLSAAVLAVALVLLAVDAARLR